MPRSHDREKGDTQIEAGLPQMATARPGGQLFGSAARSMAQVWLRWAIAV